MLDKCLIFNLFSHHHQIIEPTCSDDVIPIEHTITRDVTNGPNSLLNNSKIFGSQQLYKERDSSFIDDWLALDASAWSYISQSPGGL